jgi:hypothetical protein
MKLTKKSQQLLADAGVVVSIISSSIAHEKLKDHVLWLESAARLVRLLANEPCRWDDLIGTCSSAAGPVECKDWCDSCKARKLMKGKR